MTFQKVFDAFQHVYYTWELISSDLIVLEGGVERCQAWLAHYSLTTSSSLSDREKRELFDRILIWCFDPNNVKHMQVTLRTMYWELRYSPGHGDRLHELFDPATPLGEFLRTLLNLMSGVRPLTSPPLLPHSKDFAQFVDRVDSFLLKISDELVADNSTMTEQHARLQYSIPNPVDRARLLSVALNFSAHCGSGAASLLHSKYDEYENVMMNIEKQLTDLSARLDLDLFDERDYDLGNSDVLPDITADDFNDHFDDDDGLAEDPLEELGEPWEEIVGFENAIWPTMWSDDAPSPDSEPPM